MKDLQNMKSKILFSIINLIIICRSPIVAAYLIKGKYFYSCLEGEKEVKLSNGRRKAQQERRDLKSKIIYIFD